MVQVTKASLIAKAKQYGCASLLGTQNAKTIKGEKREILTGVLYMMPDDKLCPMSKIAGCREACLVSAGRAAFTPGIGKSRAGRTAFFHADREAFMELLCREIDALRAKAEREGKQLAIRLNGTSDINWATVMHDGKSIFEHYRDVQFYDYTKRPNVIRAAAGEPNWDVTASYSEASDHYRDLIVAAANKYGANIAVVFSDKQQPVSFLGRRVINGDETDLRFMDDRNVVVGLYAKGAAKKDSTGFVVQTANLIAAA